MQPSCFFLLGVELLRHLNWIKVMWNRASIMTRRGWRLIHTHDLQSGALKTESHWYLDTAAWELFAYLILSHFCVFRIALIHWPDGDTRLSTRFQYLDVFSSQFFQSGFETREKQKDVLLRLKASWRHTLRISLIIAWRRDNTAMWWRTAIDKTASAPSRKGRRRASARTTMHPWKGANSVTTTAEEMEQYVAYLCIRNATKHLAHITTDLKWIGRRLLCIYLAHFSPPQTQLHI